ncbi:alpha/beta hydrolase [Streptomyces sp. ISL-98]|uniref:alpha/beta fold hydrolase n=1 Tax=Streptomyces sp. ISL-98 TaxID=2819192 RepID=UPI001BE59783|nr:alpha/beta hydrolase [Streptomyces sp. ISL-98]MBT2509248.1 alpha/beta hydrolase [Streptomyces sp. ISL-98]
MTETTRIRVGDIHLSCQTHGYGEPLLLVNGMHTARAWHPLLPAFTSAGYQVTLFDQRGYLPSDVPEPPYSYEQMAEDTIGLIEELGIGPCHLLGGSGGALTIQRVCLLRPDLVRSAVLINGLGNFSPAGRVIVEATAELYALPKPPMAAVNMAVVIANLPAPSYHDPDALARAMTLSRDVLDPRSAPPAGRLGHALACVDWETADHHTELETLTRPVLVLYGQHDVLFPPFHVLRTAQVIPDARCVEIPGAAHLYFPHLDTIARHALTFLDKRR